MTVREEVQLAGSEPVVALIHGIRTRADWEEKIAERFRQEGVEHVYPLKYGRFDALSFWLPVLLRWIPVRKIREDLNDICREHEDDRIIVIAHSFGTYALGRILKRESLGIDTVVLAGSILPERFLWSRCRTRPRRVINDCAIHDVWPPLAKVTTWGYGASGVFGFGAARVSDRYFNCHHSGFFRRNFVTKYWVPLVLEDKLVLSPTAKFRSYPLPVRLLGALPVGSLTLLLALLAITLYAFFDAFLAGPQFVGLRTADYLPFLGTLSLFTLVALLFYSSRRGWKGKVYETKKVSQRDLSEVLKVSSTFFDEIPTREAVRGIYKVNKRVFFFVDEVQRGALGVSRRHVGCFSLLPLRKEAVQLLEREELDGLEMTGEHVCSSAPDDVPAALYIGAVGTTGFTARGYVLAYLNARIDDERERGVPLVYTRPVTKQGLRLVERYDFVPVGGPEEGGIGRVYRRDLG